MSYIVDTSSTKHGKYPNTQELRSAINDHEVVNMFRIFEEFTHLRVMHSEVVVSTPSVPQHKPIGASQNSDSERTVLMARKPSTSQSPARPEGMDGKPFISITGLWHFQGPVQPRNAGLVWDPARRIPEDGHWA